ncbi:MAG: hypothetical protein J7M18_01800, partial [Candidatus Eremiobacteraeota bacterium]|nr:hypothetical protein [Candidatus Eremiobacteraeota bacterium]
MNLEVVNILNLICSLTFLTMGISLLYGARKGRFLWLLGGFGLLFGVSFLLEESRFLLVHPAFKGFVPFFESFVFPTRLGALFFFFQFGVELLHGRAGFSSGIRYLPALLFLPWLISGLLVPELSAWTDINVPVLGKIRLDYMAGMLAALFAGYAFISSKNARPAIFSGITLIGLALLFGFGMMLTSLSSSIIQLVEKYAVILPWLKSGGKELPGILFFIGLSFFAGATAITLLRSRTVKRPKTLADTKLDEPQSEKIISPGHLLQYQQVLGGISEEYKKIILPLSKYLDRLQKAKTEKDYADTMNELKSLVSKARVLTGEIEAFSGFNNSQKVIVKINSIIRHIVKKFLAGLPDGNLAVFT